MPPTRRTHGRPPRKRAEGPIQLDIIIAAAVFVIAMSYTIKATIFPT